MSTTPITIRRVLSNEAETLQGIACHTFEVTFAAENAASDMESYLNESFSLKQVQAELSNPESEFYFAEAENTIAGYLKLNRGRAQTEPMGPDAVEIERIYVLEAYHGRQVGKWLLEKAMERARLSGANMLWLGVWEHNRRAIRFYEKYGFVPFGEHEFLLGEDLQTDILMKLDLKE